MQDQGGGQHGRQCCRPNIILHNFKRTRQASRPYHANAQRPSASPKRTAGPKPLRPRPLMPQGWSSSAATYLHYLSYHLPFP
eukprot:882939-Pyramimonas_sp.AAC.1